MHEEDKNFQNEGWAKKKKETAEEETIESVEAIVTVTVAVAVTTKLTTAIAVAAINRDTWNTSCATIVR